MTDLLTLGKEDIHIWLTRPEQIQQTVLLDYYRQIMTPDEQARQQRYKFAKDQHSALITRGFVRTLLSRYYPCAPQDWRFEKGEKDKPEIIDKPDELRFNLSHTDGLIVCALARKHDVGVDVEDISRNSDVLNIADRYFSEHEVKELFSLPEAEQRSRFFDYWTLKESYIKACGLGLAIPLGDFSFHINAAPKDSRINANIRLGFSEKRNDNPDNWQSWLFYLNQQYRMALSINHGHDQAQYSVRLFETVPKLWEKPLQLPLT